MWIRNSGRSDLEKLTTQQLQSKRLCSDHFQQSQFINALRSRLESEAVPHCSMLSILFVLGRHCSMLSILLVLGQSKDYWLIRRVIPVSLQSIFVFNAPKLCRVLSKLSWHHQERALVSCYNVVFPSLIPLKTLINFETRF